MFKSTIKAETLKGLVNIISTLVDEVKFTVDAEGISLKAVDPAHVAMMEMKVGASAFDSFQADNTEIGLDIDKVKDVLKLASAGDVISMEQDEDRGKLIFNVGNITRRMNLVDTSSMSDPKVPQLDLVASVEVAASELQTGIKASESISDHIALVGEGETFELSCEGDTDSVNLVLSKSQLKSINMPKRVCSLFPLDYFANIIKAVPSDLIVKIQLDNDYPLKLVFDLAGGSVTYLLAPRIESE